MVQRLQLQCHPDTPCGALSAIAVEVTREAGRRGGRRIRLRYVASGNIRAIEAPQYVSEKGRADDLWRHTCFEAFIRVGSSRAYHEFNLAPSGAWSCYRFDDYRHGMLAEKHAGPPGIDTYNQLESESPERLKELEAAGLDAFARFETPFFMLTAILDLEDTALPIDLPWHVGLSAVIEERNGTISYWALSHPPGDPDFHNPDCFALELAPARPA
jgi:hypothetical protein